MGPEASEYLFSAFSHAFEKSASSLRPCGAGEIHLNTRDGVSRVRVGGIDGAETPTFCGTRVQRLNSIPRTAW